MSGPFPRPITQGAPRPAKKLIRRHSLRPLLPSESAGGDFRVLPSQWRLGNEVVKGTSTPSIARNGGHSKGGAREGVALLSIIVTSPKSPMSFTAGTGNEPLPVERLVSGSTEMEVDDEVRQSHETGDGERHRGPNGNSCCVQFLMLFNTNQTT